MLSLSPPTVGRRVALALTVGLPLAVSAVLGAAPASAHDQLTRSDPVAGSTVTSPPTEVRLGFSEAVKKLGLTVLVTGPAGTSVTSGAPIVDGSDVVAPVGPLSESGRYVVAYRVVSSDGHPISGTFGFTARLSSAGPSGPPTPTSTPTAATAPPSVPATAAPLASGGAGVGSADGGSAWVLAGVGLLAALVVGTVLARRRLT